jgi:tRNA A-37 threonylcarbamoyl transferase component Bud32
MSLPAGPRILINDHKPSKQFTKQANAIELTRDKGIKNINIDNYTINNKTDIVKIFPGGSFAKTFLLKDRVRKYIIKNKENSIHVEKLMRQVHDLKRLNFLWTGCTPKILNVNDSNYSFYYDMEYLNNYIPMADLSNDKLEYSLTNLLQDMDNNIYSLKKEVEGISWVNKFFDKKIWPKFDIFENNSYLNVLINSEYVYINNKKYYGLRNIISKIDKHLIKPKYIRPIHGDFTLENLMINEKGKIKLIDMDGSDYYDAAEFDLGKMCQSIFSNFKDWKDLEEVVYNINLNNNEFECDNRFFEIPNTSLVKSIIKKWSSILHEDIETTNYKGIFYMSMYFIRFVPFRLKQSQNHGIFALIMAIVWLSKLLNKKNEKM